ncbi:DNA repair protein rhp57 [Cladobotryum mycophilum]|uniref:DNA repair protein rhp57 n=1 Tax=Cladobotryum mycophilum TaxID=491253 RepID=A0ABR0T0R7_9HYPO
MTDLLRILPSFPVHAFAALLPTIEQHALTTTDLLTLHPTDLAKRTHLPIIDLRRFLAAIQASLSDDLVSTKTLIPSPPEPPAASSASPSSSAEQQSDELTSATTTPEDGFISTLNDDLDAALGGGVPVGCISEFAGESGALYISTESGLATKRLAQMLESNSVLLGAAESGTPASLDNILSAVTPDLETQDHILEYQVPVLLSRHQVGLIIMDSVAANYRAEFERQGSMGSNMAARSTELIRLGALLRNLARKHNLAVVVANQVADRFQSTAPVPHLSRIMPLRSTTTTNHPPETPLASRSMAPPPISSMPTSSIHFSFPDEGPAPSPALLLDHQQRWFTGWGDDPRNSHSLKTPSLGLVWSTQISCRVALFKRPVYGRPRRVGAPIQADDDPDANAPTLKTWRRWMKVVFAPHVKASGQGWKTRQSLRYRWRV